MGSEILNTAQAAKLLGLTRQGVSKLFHAGKFPNAFSIGKAIRIPLSDIEALRKAGQK